jgi:hypothetical protein
MSDGFGLGDGMHDLGGARALAESKVADARRVTPHQADAGRWPDPGTVLRLIALVLLAILVAGLLLTVITG